MSDQRPADMAEVAPASAIWDQINDLRHTYSEAEGGGWLSTLVWNVRNAYSAWPDGTTENQAVRRIVEGFLAEIQRIKTEQIDGAGEPS